ncbi:hypothetical protein EDC14_1018105 [Hydrogenispora ethanolica]|jgi:predicted  nucleic acid-binding Zn-ribbon protein|uniref:Flagellar operon protein (TIGR03826 family) n=1 Tax=Hydrogenispora ethanolica TaxID=1082276 RepID=A0A4R1RFV5_HYDET|nr:hypothetical protein [Hydrogenispora ethanolica]TCL64806.1 hypothetical protein EDC14_1018105 [Hydrogenispora ethanolica]
MEIRNCKRCGKIFNFVGVEICNNCFLQEQTEFEKVREFIYGHPNTTVPEVSKATGVDVRVISRFLREGRLETTFKKPNL